MPRTRASLARDLGALGLAPGTTVLVHASLSSLGWVAGREVAVVQALLDVLGPSGTLVVPTQTGDNSDPARWGRPPVPEPWWPVIRAETPAYDPAVTPSRGMGALAERVRTWPGALRSDHPQHSFAALGARAAEVTAPAGTLDLSLGEASPLGALDRLGASVLFLGTGWGTCTALHLAEYRAAERTGRAGLEHYGCAVNGPDGARAWVEFDDIELDEEPFPAIGAAFERDRPEVLRRGTVGSAACLLFPLGDAVAYAVEWMVRDRAAGATADEGPA
jgi:aminoglycoside 3-N-acetyltransferase